MATKLNQQDIALPDVVIQGLQAAVVPEFSAIEKLRYVHQDDDTYIIVSDQYLLLNQERIRKVLGDDTFRAIMASFSQSLSVKKDDIPEVAQLVSVRSRFIQSKSEIAAWISGLSEQMDSVKALIDSSVADYQTRLSTKTVDSQSQSQSQSQSSE